MRLDEYGRWVSDDGAYIWDETAQVWQPATVSVPLPPPPSPIGAELELPGLAGGQPGWQNPAAAAASQGRPDPTWGATSEFSLPAAGQPFGNDPSAAWSGGAVPASSGVHPLDAGAMGKESWPAQPADPAGSGPYPLSVGQADPAQLGAAQLDAGQHGAGQPDTGSLDAAALAQDPLGTGSWPVQSPDPLTDTGAVSWGAGQDTSGHALWQAPNPSDTSGWPALTAGTSDVSPSSGVSPSMELSVWGAVGPGTGELPGVDAGTGAAPTGYDTAGYDTAGYGTAGYESAGYDTGGYDAAGYDGAGYDGPGYAGTGYEPSPGYAATSVYAPGGWPTPDSPGDSPGEPDDAGARSSWRDGAPGRRRPIDDGDDDDPDDGQAGDSRRDRIAGLARSRGALLGIGLVAVVLLAVVTFVLLGGEDEAPPVAQGAVQGRYDEEFRRSYLDTCIQASSSNAADYCACTLAKFEADYTQDEVVRLSTDVSGEESQRVVREITESCRASA